MKAKEEIRELRKVIDFNTKLVRELHSQIVTLKEENTELKERRKKALSEPS